MRAPKDIFRLKDLYNFEGFKFYESWLVEDCIVIELHRTKKTGDCPHCGKRCSRIKDRYNRRIRDLNIANTEAYIDFEEYKISCSCGYVGVEKLRFVNRYARETRRFAERIALLCKVMTLKDVAKEMSISWSAAKRIDKEEARKCFAGLRYARPKKLGVDEIAYEKGHKYLTVVRDVEKKKVIWVGRGRKKETLDLFFRKLGGRRCKRILVVVMDMWDPYISSVLEHTTADIVFDKFHVAKKINEAVDKVRRKEFAKSDKEERKNMKKKRFLILSRQKRLDDSKRETLFDLLDINKDLYSTYILKEQILDIFDDKTEERAMKRLRRWFENVALLGMGQFDDVVKTLKRYLYGIRNYFVHGLTNAASEAFNNKINVIKRKAYGFRDLDYFMFKIYQSCGPKRPYF